MNKSLKKAIYTAPNANQPQLNQIPHPARQRLRREINGLAGYVGHCQNGFHRPGMDGRRPREIFLIFKSKHWNLEPGSAAPHQTSCLRRCLRFPVGKRPDHFRPMATDNTQTRNAIVASTRFPRKSGRFATKWVDPTSAETTHLSRSPLNLAVSIG